MVSGVAFLSNKDPFDLLNIYLGLQYAILLLFFLSAHEFGHYFAAKYHKVDVTLPFYIPFPISPVAPISFGTMGALIRLKGVIPNKKALFDIGVSGPLAGFVVCFFYFVYGFLTLPGKEFLYEIHPEYIVTGINQNGLYFGDNLLFYIGKLLLHKSTFFPPMNEIYHYPFLNVAWFGMFVTALNMLPLGQLDGGHITYAMFGEKQHKVGMIVWWLITIIGLGSIFKFIFGYSVIFQEEIVSFLGQSTFIAIGDMAEFMNKNLWWLIDGWNGWLLWAFITKFFIKIKHPPVNSNADEESEEIGRVRMFFGYLSLIIFVLCFSYTGLYFLPYSLF